MVQNSETSSPKRPGRPRAYDRDEALQRATDAFWRAGYSGTSLDEIAAATGMNRPSLYAAFGDKRALYREALSAYQRRSGKAMAAILADDDPLHTTLMRIYEAALAIYCCGDEHARGCFSIGTATTEAAEDPDIRAMLAESARRLDAVFEARIRAAQKAGELDAGADPAALATLATATLHTIAIRARAGTSREDLSTLARRAVGAICGRSSDG